MEDGNDGLAVSGCFYLYVTHTTHAMKQLFFNIVQLSKSDNYWKLRLVFYLNIPKIWEWRFINRGHLFSCWSVGNCRVWSDITSVDKMIFKQTWLERFFNFSNTLSTGQDFLFKFIFFHALYNGANSSRLSPRWKIIIREHISSQWARYLLNRSLFLKGRLRFAKNPYQPHLDKNTIHALRR